MAQKRDFGVKGIDERLAQALPEFCKTNANALKSEILKSAGRKRGRPDLRRFILEAWLQDVQKGRWVPEFMDRKPRARSDVLAAKVRELAVMTATQEYLAVRDRVGAAGVILDLTGASPGPVTVKDGIRQARIYEWNLPRSKIDPKQGFATGLLHFPGSFAPYRVLRSIYKVTRPAAEFPQIVNNIVGAGIYCPRESYPSTLERRVASLLLTSEKGPGWRQKLLAYASSNIDFLSARALAEVFPESELHELRLLYHHEAHTGGGPAPLPALQLRLIEHQYSNLTWSFDPEIWRDCERAIQAAPAATLDAARPAWERASSILGIPPGVATP